VLTLADGVDPHEFIARHPAGIPDRLQIATSWFTDAKPAELRQLASVMGMLAGAVVVAYLVVVAVLLHALWSQARAGRRVLAILQAVGLTRRQLGSVVGWQALPIVAMSTLVGAPLGIVLGRWAFSVFARSFDVVDDASTPVGAIAVLVGAALVAGLVGHLAARAVAARVRTALVLRQH
jgi:putative ABC transport system permease protein